MDIIEIIKCKVEKFSYEKYWNLREFVYEGKGTRLKRYLAHYRIRKMEAFSNASIGLYVNGGGAYIASPLILPHGLNGIIINDKTIIGKDCTIFQQVTIGEWNGKAPIIGDNCLIGAGAKIIGGISIGNNVKIGANCIVVSDIPNNSTVVMEKPRIIIRDACTHKSKEI